MRDGELHSAISESLHSEAHGTFTFWELKKKGGEDLDTRLQRNHSTGGKELGAWKGFLQESAAKMDFSQLLGIHPGRAFKIYINISISESEIFQLYTSLPILQ